jgi:uncharacterized protein (TIGR00251 family)
MEPVPVRLLVRVVPGARRTDVVGRHGDAWKVRVAAAPERGRANRALERLLATRLGLPLRDVSVVSGTLTRDKVVEVRGVSADEAERRLAAGKESA